MRFIFNMETVMIGGPIPGGRGTVLPPALLASLMLSFCVVLSPSVLAQQPGPGGSPGSAPAGQQISEQVEGIVSNLHLMRAGEIRDKLSSLLQRDLADVPGRIKVAGFNALGAANERLAQDARANRLDPAAARKAQEFLDAAVSAYCKAGKAGLEASDLTAADQSYSRALSFRPDYPEAVLGMARVYAASGARSLQALEHYRRYLDLVGKVYDPRLYVEIGNAYASANLWHQAIRSFRQAVENGLDTDEVAASLAQCYLALGGDKIAEAEAQLKKAIAKNPLQPRYYGQYAQLLIAGQKLPEACEKVALGIEVARKRLAVSPDAGILLQEMDLCCSTYARALGAVLVNDPRNTKVRLSLAQCLQEQADIAQLLGLQRALAVLRDAPQTDRDGVAVLEGRIHLQQAARQTLTNLTKQALPYPKELKETCERLLRLDPGNELAKQTLAALAQDSQPAEARLNR